MQALQRSGMEETQLKSLYMIYWKSNIIYTNSTEKPLQKARNWFDGIANSICFITRVLPFLWQIQLNTKLVCSVKHFGSNLCWTLRNSGKQALGLGPSVSETQHCIHTTLSVLFSLQITSTRQCGVYISSMVCNRNSCYTRSLSSSSRRRGSIKTNESADSAQQTPQILQEL